MSNTNHDSCWGTIVGDNTNIDCDVVRQACESWNQGNNSLNAAFQEMQGNPFQAMTNFNPTIGATYIEELKNICYNSNIIKILHCKVVGYI